MEFRPTRSRFPNRRRPRRIINTILDFIVEAPLRHSTGSIPSLFAHWPIFSIEAQSLSIKQRPSRRSSPICIHAMAKQRVYRSTDRDTPSSKLAFTRVDILLTWPDCCTLSALTQPLHLLLVPFFISLGLGLDLDKTRPERQPF